MQLLLVKGNDPRDNHFRVIRLSDTSKEFFTCPNCEFPSDKLQRKHQAQCKCCGAIVLLLEEVDGGRALESNEATFQRVLEQASLKQVAR